MEVKDLKKSGLKNIAVLLFFVWTSVVLAVFTPVHAQVVINTTANMDFGRVDFAAAHNGRIQLGTDGNVQTTGFGLSARNNGNAAVAQVTLPNSGILEVKCGATGVLVDPVGTDLTISNIEIAVNTGVAFGSGIPCDGVLPADSVVMTLDMDALNDPNVLFGGEIVVVGPITLPSDKTYVTSGTGSPIQLSIVVQ